MMLPVALRMLWHKPSRAVITTLGLGALFFLSAAQVGLLVGWCGTCSALIRHADVDVWGMAEQTPAFDYGTTIPRQRLYEIRSVPGVLWAEGLFMGWNIWQRPDGRCVNVELVGLDSSCVGGPWSMEAGTVAVVHEPEGVIIDELFLNELGVTGVGDEAELIGRRARVRGVSRGVRTFTASPFVFTSINNAIRYDRRYRDDEITYVLVRCQPGTTPDQVADSIRQRTDHVEVLTTDQFVRRTVTHWMLGTGVGITVVLTAILGFLVSAVVISQTLFGLTTDYLVNYTTLLALGFSRTKLLLTIVYQSLVLGGAGIVLGGTAFVAAMRVSARTMIPLETTPAVSTGLVVCALLCSMVGAGLSVKSIWRIDPAQVLRGAG